jgi:hypothetical protein
MAAIDHLSPEQIGALANAAIIDRMKSFGHDPTNFIQGKDGPITSRFLPPTAAEDAWDAVLPAKLPAPPTRDVHPAIVALAEKLQKKR